MGEGSLVTRLGPLLGRCFDEVVYQLTWLTTMLTCLFFIRLRVSGVSSFPRRGAVIILSNHQTFLDPVMLGVTVPRQLKYAARSSLFVGIFARLIQSLGAIPLDREGVSLAGIKQILGSLGERNALVYFPEGTRTPDGNLQSFKKGAGLIIRRSKAEVVVAGIVGAYDAWPRQSPLPGRGTVWIHFRRWNRSEAASEGEEDLLRSLEETMRSVLAQSEAKRTAFLSGSAVRPVATAEATPSPRR